MPSPAEPMPSGCRTLLLSSLALGLLRCEPEPECGAGVDHGAATPIPVAAVARIPAPRLPADGGPFAPSAAEVSGGSSSGVASTGAPALGEASRCAPCHEDVVRHWSESAHARASFDNPWYRATVDALRAERGAKAARFCGGCHDPVLLLDGALDEPVAPEDPRAHAGVTCLVCHSAVATRPGGNGSYRLDLRPVPIPDPCVPAEVAAHVARLTPPALRTASLCGSCHRSFAGPSMGNTHHIAGIDDIGAWRQSAFGGSHATRLDEPLPERDCAGCHMPLSAAPEGDFAADADGQVHSHRVAGAHTALAAQLGEDPLAETQAQLRGAARVLIAAVDAGEGWAAPETARPEAGKRLRLDVVIRSLRVGHAFPGGTRDLQDTWLEVEVRDAEGRTLGSAGTAHEEVPDPSAFRLRSVLLDEEGRPEEQHLVHRFEVPAFDRTLAPRDALVVRYLLAPQAKLRLPLRAEARLRHRRHGPAMQRLACDATRSPRGRAFARASRALGNVSLDGCRDEPVTEVASTVVHLGDAPRASAPVSGHAYERAYDRALGLSHQLQEHLDEARPSLDVAMAHAQSDAQRARVHLLRGHIAARQGRRDEALREAQRAEDLAGAGPAIERVRGDAHARVWAWETALVHYRRTAEAAPGDVLAWRDRARAAGSAGMDVEALRAALRGLALGPRHPDLLRSQSLASGSEAAQQVYLRHRPIDEQPRLLRRCQREVPGCYRDRQPVPVVELWPNP